MKSLRQFTAAILAMLALLGLIGCGNNRGIRVPGEDGFQNETRLPDAVWVPQENTGSATTEPAQTIPPTPTAPQTNLFEGYDLPLYRTRYTQLTQQEQYVYMQLRQCVINDTYTCILKQVNYEQYIPLLERAAYALYADFPEFFWISHTIFYQPLSSGTVGDMELSLWCNAYWNDVTNRQARVQAVMDRAQKIAQQAKEQYSTDFERLRYIHDYITTNVTYDHEAAAMIGRPDQTAENMQAFSAYGALIRGYAVCEGYAMAYKLVTNLCGYDCEYIKGTANGKHAWNYITLDGKNYWVDVTWDDPDSEINPAVRHYNYFGISTQRLSLTHIPSDEFFSVPECNDTTYDFFYYTGSHFAQYDFEAVKEAARNQSAYGMSVNLRFDTQQEVQAAISDLFSSNQRCGQLELYGKETVTYYVNWTHNVLTLVLQQ